MTIYNDIGSARSISELVVIKKTVEAGLIALRAQKAPLLAELKAKNTARLQLKQEVESLQKQVNSIDSQLAGFDGKKLREAIEDRVWQLEFKD